MKTVSILIGISIALVILNHALFVSEIRYETVTIEGDEVSIVGTLTKPRSYDANEKYPAIAVFHGFSASKEMMRAFTEEFAKNGFLTLTVDDIGHGESDPGLGDDNSLLTTGTLTLNYLSNRNDVELTKIGMLGHSMGGNIVLETASNNGLPNANVVIGNPLEDLEDDFKELNSTNPKNLLAAVGLYDELVPIDKAKENFGVLVGNNNVDVSKLYGDFNLGTARKLITPKTDHILEILNPEIIEESVKWMGLALDVNINEEVNGFSHSIHQFISVLLYVNIVMISIFLLKQRVTESEKTEYFGIPVIFHGLFSIVGFILGGLFMTILPVIFLGLFIVWLAFVSSIYFVYQKRKAPKMIAKAIYSLKDSTGYKLGLGIFGITFIMMQLLLYYIPWDLRFAIPFLAYINTLRIIIIGIPLLVFGIIFFELDQSCLKGPSETYFKSVLNTFLARSWPYLLILLLYYPPIFLGFNGLPGIFGFLTFFIVGFIPVMLTLTFITEFPRFYNNQTLPGSIIAAGYLAWVLAATLPIS